MKKRIGKKTKQLLNMRERDERFPFCAGSFDTCPTKEIDPHNPPARCFKCPLYTESRYYKPLPPVLDDFARQVFSKD